MKDAAFWRDLEQRFAAAVAKYGDSLSARWAGVESRPNETPVESRQSGDPYGWDVHPHGLSARNRVGECWRLEWTGNEPQRKNFAWLAEPGAVGLGHSGGTTAMFFWLDRL